jgi:S-DNA-T family DNA segregation ATPase FtsK/SpoIIIE
VWRLSIVPTEGTGLTGADVVVHAEPGARVLDLAGVLAAHLGGGTAAAPPLLVPVVDGQVWPADRRLADCGLRQGDVLEVTSVPSSWTTAPARTRRTTATVRVVAGPDAGRTVRVDGDSLTVGRGSGCTVRLTDPLVSRVHARVLLSGGPVVSDEGSAHGTRVGGHEVGRPQAVGWGERIDLGGSAVVVEPPDEAVAAGAGDDGVAVLRPPRFGEALEALELDTPTPPTRPVPQPPPWAMLAMPLVLGGALFFSSRSSYALVFVVGWPLIMLLTWLTGRRHQRKQFDKELAAWREDLQVVLDRLDHAAEVQREHAEDDDPDVDVVRSRVVSRDRRLWVRGPDDDDFGLVRVGRGPVPATVTARRPTGGDREVLVEARGLLEPRAVLEQMPVTVPLLEHGVVAVTGGQDQLDAAVRAMVLRLAGGHSPAEVQVVALLGRGREHLESWLRWLPHCAPRSGGVAPVAVGPVEATPLLEVLSTEGAGRGRTVCLVDAACGLPRRVVEAAAAAGPEQGLHLLWFGPSADEIPSRTAVHVDLRERWVEQAGRGGRVRLDSTDTVGLVPAWHAARGMTGYQDAVALVQPDSALPEQVRLPDLGGDLRGCDDVEGVLARWTAARGLRAQIGSGVDGVVTIDLREDGPHGLVAGTTGSGKSELLQTLICSLAVNNPPTRITFLLVDYKGGAAFRECADLPHTVGYITDLTPALVQRALVSLHAELTHREGLLARYGAKDLVALERDHPEAAPPSLLICVDEFAALTAEVPDFVDGMVSIAQRGRSLGMHMLLATQRPAGVVTPQIKANTDLRIALRVASGDDSTDVIDTPDAAQLSRRTPGRAWVRRTGHGTTELVQVAWVGGREPVHDAAATVRVQPFSARDLGGEGPAAAGRVHPRSDLDRLVGTTTDAFVRSGLPVPRRPWLPALGGDLRVLPAEVAAVADGGATVALGLVDRPAAQTQLPWVVDYTRVGHLLVYGTSGSGKTELLRTLAAAATTPGADTAQPPAVVYGIDCGGGGLVDIEALPGVGSVVVEAHLERVMRLVRMLAATVRQRNAALAQAGAADLAALARSGTALPRLHVLVDNLPGLLDAFEGGGSLRRSHVDLLLGVLQEGRRVGVHVTATSPRRVGIPSAHAAAFGSRLVLRMTVDDDYAMLGVPAGVLDPQSCPGRGLTDAGEVQVSALPPGSTRWADWAGAVADAAADRVVPGVAVPVMPGRLPAHLVPAGTRDEVCLGVEAEFAGPVVLPLAGQGLLVTGRSGSGRTSTLLGLAQAASSSHRPPQRVVLAGPRTGTGRTGAAAADLVLDDLAAFVDWAQGPDGVDHAPSDGSWSLLLLDDVHTWERGWDAGGTAREDLTAAASVLERAMASGWAVVLATDPDEARARGHVAGPVQVVRRRRRALLLQPDGGDGGIAGVTVPMATLEPLVGTGRGLLCVGGQARVVQAVCPSLEDDLPPAPDATALAVG